MKYTPKCTPSGAGWDWTNLDAIGNKKPWKPDGARVLGINWMSLEYCLERAMGIEPTALAWEARVLPLYDARAAPHFTRVLWGLANRGNGRWGRKWLHSEKPCWHRMCSSGFDKLSPLSCILECTSTLDRSRLHGLVRHFSPRSLDFLRRRLFSCGEGQ